MKAEHVKLLVCPACKSDLRAVDPQVHGDRIESGSLKCLGFDNSPCFFSIFRDDGSADTKYARPEFVC